jgi:hypothetical protein
MTQWRLVNKFVVGFRVGWSIAIQSGALIHTADDIYIYTVLTANATHGTIVVRPMRMEGRARTHAEPTGHSLLLARSHFSR